MDNETLAHSTWNCKYHIVFSPKYRRQIIYSKLRTEIGKIIRTTGCAGGPDFCLSMQSVSFFLS